MQLEGQHQALEARSCRSRRRVIAISFEQSEQLFAKRNSVGLVSLQKSPLGGVIELGADSLQMQRVPGEHWTRLTLSPYGNVRMRHHVDRADVRVALESRSGR